MIDDSEEKFTETSCEDHGRAEHGRFFPFPSHTQGEQAADKKRDSGKLDRGRSKLNPGKPNAHTSGENHEQQVDAEQGRQGEKQPGYPSPGRMMVNW